MRFSIQKTNLPLIPLRNRARNFAKALTKNAASAIKGKKWSRPQEEAEYNHAICQGCSLYRPEDDICTHPACNCPMKRKSRWKTTSCPIGKW